MNGIPTDKEFLTYTALSLSGPVIWSVHFAIAYGIQYVTCMTAFIPARFVMPIILGSTFLAVLLITSGAWGILKGGLLRETSDKQVVIFYKCVSTFLLILSLFGVIATCAACLLLPACATLR